MLGLYPSAGLVQAGKKCYCVLVAKVLCLSGRPDTLKTDKDWSDGSAVKSGCRLAPTAGHGCDHSSREGLNTHLASMGTRHLSGAYIYMQAHNI